MMNVLVRAVGVVSVVVLAAGPLTPPAASGVSASPRAVQARAAAVTLKASAPRVDTGKRLVLTGKVRNRPVGTVVQVQRSFRYEGVWATVGKTKVGKRGAVRYVDVPKRAGERSYRLVVTKHGRAVSKAVTVTVWTWHDLDKQRFFQRRATFQGQTEFFGGDGNKHENVILADNAVDQGFMTWHTEGTCTRARAYIESTDGTLGVAHGQFTVDGVVVAESDLEGSSGRRLYVDVDTTGADTIGFAWQKVDDAFAIGMYDASMYCPFR